MVSPSPGANERRGNFTVKGPIAVGRATCRIERANKFFGGESYMHHSRSAVDRSPAEDRLDRERYQQLLPSVQSSLHAMVGFERAPQRP